MAEWANGVGSPRQRLVSARPARQRLVSVRPARQRRIRIDAALLALLAVIGCGTRPPTSALPKAETPQLHQGALTDLVPAAGLRWLVVARPKQLLSDPQVTRATDRLFPPKQLQAFADISGLDLRNLESSAVAGFDIGTLYLAETRSSIGVAQQSFVDRLVSDPVVKHPSDRITITTGIIGTTPESFVAMEGIGIGVAVKDPLLAKIVSGFALGKLKKSPSAFNGAALRDMPTELAQFPAQFYALGPFEGKWAEGAEGLLGHTTAVAVVARPDHDGLLRLKILATGSYGNDLSNVNLRVRQLYLNLAQSDLGRLFGFASDDVTPEIAVESQRVAVTLAIPLKRLMDGLYTAVAAEVWDLLELRKPPKPVTQPGANL